MSQPGLILALSAAVLTVPLLLLKGRGRTIAQVRILLHLLVFQAFGVAGWLIARDGQIWPGGIVVAFGFVWTGFFWMASVRQRLAEMPEPVDLPHGSDERPPEANIEPGEIAELEPSGQAILARLIAMKERRIGEVVTPREEIVFADCAGGIDEAVDRIRKTRFVRIPMADGSLDRIVGVVHAKDVVPLVVEGRQKPPLKRLMRRPLFVSRDRTMATLLELFRSQRGHLAIVVDEYNRAFGLVSRDDVFRHLTGGSEAQK